MELTAAYLREKFRAFNAAYFGGELPEPRLVVSNARTQLGLFSCVRRRKWLLGKASATGFTIKVSEYYDLPEEEYLNVLLHEMIHYYIAYKGIGDTAPHGVHFRRLMAALNAKGWHITVSARTKQWPVAERNRRKQFLVVAVETTDALCFLSVVNPAYRAYIDRMAQQSPIVKAHHWIVSDDAQFASFPQARSLRSRRVSREVYEEVRACGIKAPAPEK